MNNILWLQHYLFSIKKNTQSYMNKKMKKDQINSSQAMFIVALKKSELCTQAELSKVLECDKAHTNRVVRDLLTKKIIKQNETSSNKNISLELTNKGLLLANKLIECMEEWNNYLFNGVSEEELKHLQLIIEKITANSERFENVVEEK